MAGGVEGIRRALVLGLLLIAGTAIELAPSVGPRHYYHHAVCQCLPTGAPRSPCAPRCIVKGSARDDITNK